MNEKTKSKDNIRHIFSLLARSSSIDFQTNVLSISDVLEYINLDKEQLEKNSGWSEGKGVFLPLNFELITLWSREGVKSVDAQFKVEIVNPFGKILKTAENKLQFNDDKKRTRVRLRFNGLPVTGEGVYHVRISLQHKDDDFTLVGQVPVEIRIMDKKPNV